MIRNRSPKSTIDPDGEKYKSVVPYLVRISHGDSITCQQIAKELGISETSVLLIFSHYLKHLQK